MIQAIRGMNDLLPEDTSVWQQVEKVLRSTMNSYGYDEVRMPIVEKTIYSVVQLAKLPMLLKRRCIHLRIAQEMFCRFVMKVPPDV